MTSAAFAKARLGNTGGHRLRLTKEERDEIVQLFLVDPVEATRLTVSKGMTAAYAYKITYERGLLPRLRKEWGGLREGEA